VAYFAHNSFILPASICYTGLVPPVSLLRQFGFCTRQEIDMEKYALKALCKDSNNMEHHGKHHREHHGEHLH